MDNFYHTWYTKLCNKKSRCREGDYICRGGFSCLFSKNERKYFSKQQYASEYLMKNNYELGYDIITTKNIEECPIKLPNTIYSVSAIFSKEHKKICFFEFSENALEYQLKIDNENKDNKYYTSNIDVIILDKI